MNKALISNWNSVVKPSDTVYFLGDFAFRNHEEFLRRLNGRKILIPGHHDQGLEGLHHYFDEVTPLKQVTIDGQALVLCHYPMREWPGRDRGAWHLHGHSHGKNLPSEGKQWDVGVDVNNYRPLSLTQIRAIMANRTETRRLMVFDPYDQGQLKVKYARKIRTVAPRLSR
jgi:calcineurin-like phosphoesterase family protein